MQIYPIYLSRFDEDGEGFKIRRGPTIGSVLATCLTWHGMKRRFRKLDWKKEIINHLIFIDERDMFEAVDVEIEEIANTTHDKETIPEIEARVTYSVKDKSNGVILHKWVTQILIAPILDAKI